MDGELHDVRGGHAGEAENALNVLQEQMRFFVGRGRDFEFAMDKADAAGEIERLVVDEDGVGEGEIGIGGEVLASHSRSSLHDRCAAMWPVYGTGGSVKRRVKRLEGGVRRHPDRCLLDTNFSRTLSVGQLKPTRGGCVSGSITVMQGAQIVPIVPQVLKRHPRLVARGVHVEHHSNDPAAYPERELQQHNLYLHTGQAVRAEITSPEFSGMRWIRPGAFWVMPQGSRHAVRFEGCAKVEGVALAFDPLRFDEMVQSAGGSCSTTIVQSLAMSPPKIEHLMRALEHESKEPSSDDGFGLECIATAIALALSQHARATNVSPDSAKTGTRLSPRQIRAVQAYVEDHLEGTITLAELAGAAGLSAFHFLRAFKQSTGVTPGKYVLERRMERARLLLRDDNASVAEVGLRVGFEHACHFTRAFRRSVGMAPSMFRNSL